MYNIKQAAARAGVSVPVLRAWERRYGVVHPARTSSGYRVFDDAAVARIRTMRNLITQGWSPSAAAAAIVAGTVEPDAVAERTDGTDARSGADGAGARATPDTGATLRETEAEAVGARFVAAARSMDPRAVDAVLDEVFARGSFERVATDLLFPALQRLGDAWAAGEVSVAGEHLASNAVLRRLAMALEAAGSSSGAPTVVVGLPPGSRHELGALAFAVAARRSGLSVAYLGPDLPVEDWVRAGAGAAAAVIGVVTGRERRAALDVARSLRAAHPDLIVAFGGESAPTEPDVLLLTGPLSTATAALRQALDARPA